MYLKIELHWTGPLYPIRKLSTKIKKEVLPEIIKRILNTPKHLNNNFTKR
jgi:hypothetical protein